MLLVCYPLQFNSDMHRSLDHESFNMPVTPATSRFSIPTIIKLYPPTVRPVHSHANMPMRFGRESDDDERAPNSNPNMPQRFGRSWELMQMCAKCAARREGPKQGLRDRLGSLLWSLLRTLANEQPLHW